MAKISILTSKSTSSSPSDPPSADWVSRHYRESAYGAVGAIDFKPAITARHVAVYSNNAAPLSLAEVEVYGKLILHHDIKVHSWIFFGFFLGKRKEKSLTGIKLKACLSKFLLEQIKALTLNKTKPFSPNSLN